MATSCSSGGGEGTAAPTTASGQSTNGAQAPSGDPIRIGSTLALTGPFAATAAIHKIAGEEYIKQLNENGGLLGRPVEWVLLDDGGDAAKSAAEYERLITQENVDLIIGPYGTGAITAAMPVAERYGFVFPHHTASLTYAYTYKYHFPTWSVGLNTHYTTPRKIYEAYQSLPTPPKTVGFVTNRFPGSDFLVHGAKEGNGAFKGEGGAIRVAEEMGMESVLDVSFDTGTTDFAPIAARIKAADPDLLYVGALGVDGPNLLASLAQINYKPRNQFYQWPAPGPMLGAGDIAEGATSVTIFEATEPYVSNTDAKGLVERYVAAAKAADFKYTAPETQAGASWAAWQTLIAGVNGCECLDQEKIGDWLLANEVDTVEGPLVFKADEQNYGEDIQTIKQIQDGDWHVVYPPDAASDGRSMK